MKKLINAVDDVCASAKPRPLCCAVTSSRARSLVSVGGSGHEPLHAGFVGLGMLDAVVPGQVFTSPGPDLILAAAEAADTGIAVLFIVKNYEGDVMNSGMAHKTGTHEANVRGNPSLSAIGAL